MWDCYGELANTGADAVMSGEVTRYLPARNALICHQSVALTTGEFDLRRLSDVQSADGSDTGGKKLTLGQVGGGDGGGEGV